MGSQNCNLWLKCKPSEHQTKQFYIRSFSYRNYESLMILKENVRTVNKKCNLSPILKPADYLNSKDCHKMFPMNKFLHVIKKIFFSQIPTIRYHLLRTYYVFDILQLQLLILTTNKVCIIPFTEGKTGSESLLSQGPRAV